MERNAVNSWPWPLMRTLSSEPEMKGVHRYRWNKVCVLLHAVDAVNPTQNGAQDSSRASQKTRGVHPWYTLSGTPSAQGAHCTT